MPVTTTRVEKFSKSVPVKDILRLTRLRVSGGAIRSIYSSEGDEWVIKTEWNAADLQ